MGELSAAVREANLLMTERAILVENALSVTPYGATPLPQGEAFVNVFIWEHKK